MSFSTPGYALVTGAGSGIGRAAALGFAQNGASGVLFADIDVEAANEAATRSHSLLTNPSYKAEAVQVDTTNASSVQEMVNKAIEAFGRIDYAVNSAGIGVDNYVPLTDVSPDEWDNIQNVNTKGTLNFLQPVLKAMQRQDPFAIQGRTELRSIGRGAIVNVTSALGFTAAPGLHSYTASKHAVIGLTKTAGNEIRVNAMCPSWVNTPMMDRDIAKVPQLSEIVKKTVPLGRMASVDEVTDSILYLCSPGSSYVTGVGFLVDGGTLAAVNLG